MGNYRFGNLSPGDIDDRRYVLQFDNGIGMTVTRQEVLDWIQQLVQGGYGLGLNPLSHLRKFFSAFSWEFVKIPADWEAIATNRRRWEIINDSDFFWDAQGDNGDFKQYVTAKLKKHGRGDEKPWRIYATRSLVELTTNKDISPVLSNYGLLLKVSEANDRGPE